MTFLERMHEWFHDVVLGRDEIEVTVQRGDTLWEICRRATGSTKDSEIAREVGKVIDLNPGLDPDNIRPGQKLKLPRHWG